MLVPCASAVSFSGEDNIAVYSSSETAERGFCKSCGSNLFYRMKENHHHYIPASLFENQDSFSFNRQIFIDKKPSFYTFENDTIEITEDQFFG